MKTEGIFIDVKEIRKIYNEFFEDESVYIISEYVTNKKFEEFLRFLKIDLSDWVKGNLRYFE